MSKESGEQWATDGKDPCRKPVGIYLPNGLINVVSCFVEEQVRSRGVDVSTSPLNQEND